MRSRCEPREFKHRPAEGIRRGFSLIEVVLAVGIIAFAFVAFLALFGASLRSSRQVIDEDEALGVARALPAYLQSVGFSTVYGWIQSPSAAPALYGYSILPSPPQSASGDTDQQSVIYSGTDSGLTASATTYLNRAGALFAIQLSLSPNMPIHSGTGANVSIISQPAVAELPSAAAAYPESVLAIQAAIYPVSAVLQTGTNPIPPGTYPAFTYDTTVSR